MKPLTKIVLLATCLSVIVLWFTSGVTQSLESDGRQMFDILTWHIPFYRSVRISGWEWWVFVRLWLVSLLIPSLLWLAVGLRKIFAKTNLQ
jgi:hypothetical protein